jgi:hypothetical protein
MTGRPRCDEILRLIDEALADKGVESAGEAGERPFDLRRGPAVTEGRWPCPQS